ncbi:hypothetical protein TB2_041992 [Malus domestica]
MIIFDSLSLRRPAGRIAFDNSRRIALDNSRRCTKRDSETIFLLRYVTYDYMLLELEIEPLRGMEGGKERG